MLVSLLLIFSISNIIGEYSVNIKINSVYFMQLETEIISSIQVGRSSGCIIKNSYKGILYKGDISNALGIIIRGRCILMSRKLNSTFRFNQKSSYSGLLSYIYIKNQYYS